MARIIPAFTQFFDNAGDPLVDGKLFFYDTGSTTPKNTYKDVGETTNLVHTNPVILSGAGRAPDIYGTGSYRVIITDKNDVQIAVSDPVGGTGTQEFGADWISDVTYQVGDIVREDNVYYQGQSSNNRGNTPSTDGGSNWVTWPPNTQDAEVFRDEAEVFRNEAEVFKNQAETAEAGAVAAQAASEAARDLSLQYRNEAEVFKDEAEDAADRAEAAAIDFTSTSTTSVTIGLGAKVFTVELAKAYAAGQVIKIVETGDPVTNFMIATVTDYDSGTGQLDVNATRIGGSGTYSSWSITINTVDAYSVGESNAIFAPLDSPALINNPTAPTQSQGDNSTKLATTAYVDEAAGAAGLYKLIEAWTPTAVSSKIFTWNESQYGSIFVVIDNVEITLAAIMRVRVGHTNGTVFDSGNNYAFNVTSANSTASQASSTSGFPIASYGASTLLPDIEPNIPVKGQYTLLPHKGDPVGDGWRGFTYFEGTGNTPIMSDFICQNEATTTDTDAIQFVLDGGTFSAGVGKISVYGIEV